jgi:hypothetical protein
VRWRFHPAAGAEHLGHVAYYETHRTGLGGAYLAEFEAALALICEGPQRFAVVVPPDIRRLHLRRFPILVIFQERSGEVLILAVGHKRRRPDYWSVRK